MQGHVICELTITLMVVTVGLYKGDNIDQHKNMFAHGKMFGSYMITVLVLLVSSVAEATEVYRGVLTLDDLTFDKIATRFEHMLVKFDNAYPYGREHENFVQLGRDLTRHSNIVAVNLEIKDYGDKESLDIAQRFGIKKEQYPALVMLHNAGHCCNSSSLRSVRYHEERNQTTDKIVLDPARMRVFIYQETGIRLSLPNCTKDLDQLVDRFIGHLFETNKSDETTRTQLDKILAQVKRMTEKSSPSKQRTARHYLKLMTKAMERDNLRLFFESEHQRVVNMLGGKSVSHGKRDELRAHDNIVHSFLWAVHKHQRARTNNKTKDEL